MALYAVATFTHMDRTWIKGQEVADGDPMAQLRPDLFTSEKPATKATSKQKES